MSTNTLGLSLAFMAATEWLHPDVFVWYVGHQCKNYSCCALAVRNERSLFHASGGEPLTIEHKWCTLCIVPESLHAYATPSFTLYKIHTQRQRCWNLWPSNSHHTHSRVYHVSGYCAVLVCISVFPNNITANRPTGVFMGAQKTPFVLGQLPTLPGWWSSFTGSKTWIFSFCVFIVKLEKRKCIVSGTSMLMHTAGTVMQGQWNFI